MRRTKAQRSRPSRAEQRERAQTLPPRICAEIGCEVELTDRRLRWCAEHQRARPSAAPARPTLGTRRGEDGHLHLTERRCPRCRIGKVPITERWGTLCRGCQEETGR